MTEDPIAKLGDLTKPATVLIEKISEAVGGVFKPYQIVRVAKAQAEAGNPGRLPAQPFHSALAPESFTTLAHLTISAA